MQRKIFLHRVSEEDFSLRLPPVGKFELINIKTLIFILMYTDQSQKAEVIVKQFFTSLETIDEDVFSKLSNEKVGFLDVIKSLRTIGFSIGDAKKLLSVSKYYAQSYKTSESHTQSFFDALVDLSKTDDSITLTENGVSIDLTKLREEDQ